ncbi:hypothetical protein BJV82DRAFT_634120 [Fennellomyces sp. T-0311]|nr:hypothetical protein BJV82DRAFT_634120 [Fennellomyces sp. T-0311]
MSQRNIPDINGMHSNQAFRVEGTQPNWMTPLLPVQAVKKKRVSDTMPLPFFSLTFCSFMNFTTGRRRASISSTLPRVTSPQPPTVAHNPRSRHQYSRSQQLPSTSSPFGNPRSPGHHSSLSIGSNESSSEPSTPHFGPRSTNTVSVEFDGDTQMVILRPNRIIRGRVVVHAVERIYVTQIQIKFRAEEVAMAKVDATMHQCITTLFEAQYTVWGDSPSAYAHTVWEELDVGRYQFPFVLKFPNVNYPPSTEDPPGFSIRYIWTAHINGPPGQSGLSSKRLITPYRPIIASPPDKEWVYRATLTRDTKQTAVAQVLAKLNKQCYCPDEPFAMQLTIPTLQSDIRIAQISYKFRKHHQGKLMISGGTAVRHTSRDLLHGNVLQQSDTPSQTVSFDIPTRNVSPTFASRHTCVYYDLHFTVVFEESHFLKRSTIHCEFAIPINIANLPNDELMRVPDLVTIQYYTQPNIKYPEFLDPTQPDDSDPPSYNSLQQYNRPERAIYLTGSTQLYTMSGHNDNSNGSSHVTVGCSTTVNHQRRGSFPDIGDATVIPGVYDGDW